MKKKPNGKKRGESRMKGNQLSVPSHHPLRLTNLTQVYTEGVHRLIRALPFHAISKVGPPAHYESHF